MQTWHMWSLCVMKKLCFAHFALVFSFDNILSLAQVDNIWLPHCVWVTQCGWSIMGHSYGHGHLIDSAQCLAFRMWEMSKTCSRFNDMVYALCNHNNEQWSLTVLQAQINLFCLHTHCSKKKISKLNYTRRCGSPLPQGNAQEFTLYYEFPLAISGFHICTTQHMIHRHI